MEALDDLYKKNARDEKQEILEGRKKKLSNLLLKEKKEFEVLCLFLFSFCFYFFKKKYYFMSFTPCGQQFSCSFLVNIIFSDALSELNICLVEQINLFAF